MNCAVFASGGGTTFGSLIERHLRGELEASLTLLVSNNSKCGAMQRAKDAGIPTRFLPPSRYQDITQYTKALLETLSEYEIGMIACAGYMKKIPTEVVSSYSNRILNIHPALLPAFGGRGMYGIRVHRAVLEYGAKVSGMTVHLIDEEYDQGPVVCQKTVDVEDDDTPESLAARIHELELAWYWRCVKALACGALSVKGRKVSGDV